MAVYTKVSDSDITTLLQHYSIGTCIQLKGIEAGVENSNYLLTTSDNRYILTIYEKRVKVEELPFFLSLMNHLSGKGIPCPVPIRNKDGQLMSEINGRTCAIVSFLNGKDVKSIKNYHLSELGQALAQMHLASADFPMQRSNNFSLPTWLTLFDSVKHQTEKVKTGLTEEIAHQLDVLSQKWPTQLPSGVIHADLFPDNVFFEGEKLVGIIDFYFACNDAWMYDLAICLNAWCFENNNEFNITKAKLLLFSYNQTRPLSEKELDALPILASGAAMRFLLTRLYDWLNRPKDALVKPKDPLDYLKRLRFHQRVLSHKEYGL